MFVNHLGHRIAQQNNILIKRLYLALQLDSVNQIYRNWYVLFTQCIKKRILKKLTFIAHDILRVQTCCCKPTPYHSTEQL